MKSNRYIRSLVSLLAAAVLSVSSVRAIDITSVSSDIPSNVLLSDSFSTLDSARWYIDNPYWDSSVTIANGEARSFGRGYLISKDSYLGDMEFQFSVKLISRYSSATFVWKTDGTHTGGCQSPTNGLEVSISHEKQWLLVKTYDNAHKVVPLSCPLETWINFRVTDENSVVKVYVNGSSTPIVEFPYVQSAVGTGGKISFSSRESLYTGIATGASLSSFNLVDLTPPPVVVEVVVEQPVEVVVVVDTPTEPEVVVVDEGGSVIDVGEVVAIPPTEEDTVISQSKRKAYGITNAQANRLTKGSKFKLTKNLPAGIYTFAFLTKETKKGKFSASIIELKK